MSAKDGGDADTVRSERPGRPVPIGADLVIPLMSIGLTLYYVVSTRSLTWEARSTGWLIGFALLALCAAQLGTMVLQRWRGEATFGLGGLLADTPDNRKRLGLLLVLILFVAALPLTGTTLGLFLVMAAALSIMGVRQPRQIVGIALATSASVFLLFMLLLKSKLPRGALDHALVALLTGQGG